MWTASHLQLIFAILFILVCSIKQANGNAERRRRQVMNSNNRNIASQQGNPNGYLQSNNVPYNPNSQQQQQQSIGNALSSQGQGQPVRSRGFYSSPNFKPPSFSGEKPVGWFDTKYQYWVSDQNEQMNKVEGKNAAPSNLQAKALQSPREDDGALFFDKLSRQYAQNNEGKSYYRNKFFTTNGRGSVCYNRQSYNGYQFAKFRCPLPASTGMNQLDTYCCGIANYQYCCNEREFYRSQGGGYGDDNYYGKHGVGRSGYNSSRQNLALAIALPIVGLIVIAGAVVIVFFYYKKIRYGQSRDASLTDAFRTSEKYSAIPQEPAGDKPIVPPRESRKTNVQA